MIKLKSLSIQTFGKLFIAAINTGFTFLNSFIFSDAQLIDLVQLAALIAIFSTIFELGSSRMVMQESLNEDRLEQQYQIHFSYILSNTLIVFAFLFLSIMVFPYLREPYFFFIIIISLSLAFILPQRMLALKSEQDFLWLFYEFILSSVFILLSLFLYIDLSILEALKYISCFYAVIAIYTVIKQLPKLIISFTHLKKNFQLVIESFITSFFINSLAFWNLGISEKSQYFTVRLISLSKIFSSLYVNNVYQTKKNNFIVAALCILIILCIYFFLQYYRFIDDEILPLILWLSIFLYVVVIWVSNIFQKKLIWWINFSMLCQVLVFYYLFKVSPELLLFSMFIVSGGSYFVLLRKH